MPNRVVWPAFIIVALAAVFAFSLLVWQLRIGPSEVSKVLQSDSLPKTRTLGNQVAGSLDWSPDGRYLAAGHSIATSAHIWDVEVGRTLMTLSSFRGGVALVSWSPDGKYLVTVSNEPNNTLRLWDTARWQPLFMTDPAPNTDTTYTSVTSVSWSPDSKQFAAGLSTGTMHGIDHLKQIGATSSIMIFDVPSGKVSATLVHPSISGIASVDWSPDGKSILFAVSPDDNGDYLTLILVWDLSAGAGLSGSNNTREIARESAMITFTSVIWSPDGKYVATNSANHTVKVFHANTGELAYALPTDGEIVAVDWSSDGKHLAAAVIGPVMNSPESDYVQVWDVQTKQAIAIFKVEFTLKSLAWSPDNEYLAASSGLVGAGTVMVRSLRESGIAPPTPFTASAPDLQPGRASLLGKHAEFVKTVAWSPNGKLVASGGEDKHVYIWEVATGQTVATLRLFAGVETVVWSPDGKFLATTAYLTGYEVQIWDTTTWQIYLELRLGGKVVDADWSPDGQKLAVGRGNYGETPEGWLLIYDVSSGELLEELALPEMATHVAWSPDGAYVAVANSRETNDSKPSVWVWSAADWSIADKLLAPTATPKDDLLPLVSDLEWSPYGKTLAIPFSDKEIRLYSPYTKGVKSLKMDTFTRDVSWLPSGAGLLGNYDGDIVLWDVEGQKRELLHDTETDIIAVDVSPDGRMITYGGWDGTVGVLVLK